MKFSQLNIDQKLLKSLDEMHFAEMTDIQEKCIPLLLEGKDLIGQSMTGSGKTAAFGVPIVHKLEPRKGVQSLIVAPTRELAVQVAEHMQKFAKHSSLRVAPVFGGVSFEPQVVAIASSEIVVGTPGRLLDHMRHGTLRVNNVKILVLDEADRMFDMGFIDDIRTIISQTPVNRQTIMFSATMPDEVVAIARTYMKNPVKIKTQHFISKHLLKHFYYDVNSEDKPSLLIHLIKKENPSLAIVFCATRHITDIIERNLIASGIKAHAIHGGLTQQRRLDVLERFNKAHINVLVATDVAARGLDIMNVSHIFNYDIPNDAEDYTHRVGRTARFGKTGKAISLLSQRDHDTFRKIVKYLDIEKAAPEKFEHLRLYTPRERTADEKRIGAIRPGWRKSGFGHSSRGSGYGSRSSSSGRHSGNRRKRFGQRRY